MSTTYIYRGIYDEGEVGRIQGVLDEQRQMFNEEDAKHNTKKSQLKKYGFFALGAVTILVVLKIITNIKKS